jgi:hypothetical protein
MDFKIYTIDASGHIFARRDVTCDNKEEAIAEARAMVAPRGGSLEVWDLATLVETIRPAEAA